LGVSCVRRDAWSCANPDSAYTELGLVKHHSGAADVAAVIGRRRGDEPVRPKLEPFVQVGLSPRGCGGREIDEAASALDIGAEHIDLCGLNLRANGSRDD